MSHAERLGLDLTRVGRMAAFCGIGGLLGAHYVDLFRRYPPPERYASAAPWRAYLRDQLRWRPRLG